MRSVSIRFYGLLSTLQPRTNTKRPSAAGVHGAASSSGVRVLSEVFVGTDAALARTLPKHKKMSVEQARTDLKKAKESISGAHYLTLLLQTQPGLTGIGKKKPELMEVALSGSLDEVRASEGSNSVIVEFDGDGSFLQSLPGVARATIHNNSAELRLEKDADTQAILHAAVPRPKLSRFEVAVPSLEEIFIGRVGVEALVAQAAAQEVVA